MKRALMAALLMAGPVLAVGTVTQTLVRLGDTDTFAVTITWTADGADGSVPATVIARSSAATRSTDGMSILSVEIDPGSPAPTANYDITFIDQYGHDILGAACINRSATVTEVCAPVNTMPLSGDVSFTVAGNSTNSAAGTVVIRLAFSTVAKMGGTGGGGGGTGDVVGPASATANAIAAYSDTTGKLLKNSLARVTADGSIAVGDGSAPGGIALYEPSGGGDHAFMITMDDTFASSMCIYPKSDISNASGRPFTLTGASKSRTVDGGSYTCYEFDFEAPAGGGGGGFFSMYQGTGSQTPGSSTRYFLPGYTGILSDESIPFVVPGAVTVTSMSIRTYIAQPADGSNVYTLRKNGSDTDVVVTVAASTGSGVHVTGTGSAVYAAGDTMTIKSVNNATTSSTSPILIGIGW